MTLQNNKIKITTIYSLWQTRLLPLQQPETTIKDRAVMCKNAHKKISDLQMCSKIIFKYLISSEDKKLCSPPSSNLFFMEAQKICLILVIIKNKRYLS